MLVAFLLSGCVLPPVDPSDEALDSADSVERELPPATQRCPLTIATICGDCDVTVDWSATTAAPFDASTPDFVAVWTYVETTPPPDLVDALCNGAEYERPDRLSYLGDFPGFAVVLGRDVPRATGVAIFEVGIGFDYLQALLVPDPGSVNDHVAFE